MRTKRRFRVCPTCTYRMGASPFCGKNMVRSAYELCNYYSTKKEEKTEMPVQRRVCLCPTCEHDKDGHLDCKIGESRTVYGDCAGYSEKKEETEMEKTRSEKLCPTCEYKTNFQYCKADQNSLARGPCGYYIPAPDPPGETPGETPDVTRDQVGGDHYKTLDPEPIDVIKAWGLSFCLGNVVKYVARNGRKPGSTKEEDLGKAIQYLELELEN